MEWQVKWEGGREYGVYSHDECSHSYGPFSLNMSTISMPCLLFACECVTFALDVSETHIRDLTLHALLLHRFALLYTHVHTLAPSSTPVQYWPDYWSETWGEVEKEASWRGEEGNEEKRELTRRREGRRGQWHGKAKQRESLEPSGEKSLETPLVSVGLGRGAKEKEKRWCCMFICESVEKKEGGVGEERKPRRRRERRENSTFLFCFVANTCRRRGVLFCMSVCSDLCSASSSAS
jgi:hypothetical protein